MSKNWRVLASLPLLLGTVQPVAAKEMRSGGKLLLTGGVSSVEGASGGGLATWALITGNETADGIGGSVHASYVALPDFDLASAGAAIGIRNRVELSYTHQVFDTRSAGAALGLGHGFKFGQDVFGAKVRLIRDAVYDQDRLLPQISVAMQYKRAEKGEIVRAVGAKQTRGADFLVSATKVLLAQSIVIDTTVRFTKANQFGLLGFGGDKHDTYHPQFEGSAGVLLTRRVLIGGEVRTKPSNLGFAREQNSYDLFGAWQATHRVAVTLAYVDLGDIATVREQRGAFLSLQGSF